MSLLLLAVHKVGSGFPRVSGDEPVTTKVRTAPIKFSPRERG